jgi:hypothetical protein
MEVRGVEECREDMQKQIRHSVTGSNRKRIFNKIMGVLDNVVETVETSHPKDLCSAILNLISEIDDESEDLNLSVWQAGQDEFAVGVDVEVGGGDMVCECIVVFIRYGLEKKTFQPSDKPIFKVFGMIPFVPFLFPQR